MNITITDFPPDFVELLDIIEGAARIRGISQGRLIAELLDKEVQTWTGYYPLGAWTRVRLEDHGLKEKFYPNKKQQEIIRELEERA